MVDWLIRFAPAMHTSGVSVSPGNQGRGLEICLMPHCDQPQKKKCRWCPLHNCHLDNMKYAVAHNKVNCSKEKRIAWSEEMKDVNKAIAAITKQEENNAGLPKWGNTNWQTSKALKVAEMTSQEESGVSPASPGKQGNSDQKGGLQKKNIHNRHPRCIRKTINKSRRLFILYTSLS